MKKHIQLLIPSYAEGFHCLGGACEDSCCIGWDIDIDKKTFKRYSKTRFARHLYRNRESCDKKVDYGRISVDESNRCPYLDQENLCQVYGELGEDSLSNVCYSFPRIYNVLNGVCELSLHMSCPEAVRKLLSSKEPVTFSTDHLSREKYIIYSTFKKEEELPRLRSLSIELIQNRSVSIKQRLLDLGSALKFGDSGHTLKREDKYRFRLDFFRYVIESLGGLEEIRSSSFASSTKALVDQFSLLDYSISESAISLYKKTVDNLVVPFTEKYDYAFERYLVNSVFQDNFPFSINHNESDGYIILVVRLALMQFYLAGIAAEKVSLAIDDLALIIQNHAKVLNHHRTFTLNLLYEIKRKLYDNLDFLSLLLD